MKFWKQKRSSRMRRVGTGKTLIEAALKRRTLNGCFHRKILPSGGRHFATGGVKNSEILCSAVKEQRRLCSNFRNGRNKKPETKWDLRFAPSSRYRYNHVSRRFHIKNTRRCRSERDWESSCTDNVEKSWET